MTSEHRVGLRACTNERDFADHVLGCLSPWFKIDREVPGRHPFRPRPLRIDAVLQPLDPTGWLDTNPVFGVEFKHELVSTRDRMTHAAQAVDYTFVDWNGYGRLGVFMCAPSQGVFPVPIRTLVTDPLPANGGWANPNFVAAHLIGQFTVGELCYLGGFPNSVIPRRKWTLLIHGEHVLWSEGRGVEGARYRTLKPKVGSR